jgi:hypothetical protein
MALRTALSFVQEMEKELGAALLIRITGPDYDGTPLNATDRERHVLFGTIRTAQHTCVINPHSFWRVICYLPAPLPKNCP